jgi:FtsZ-binding cell division protein ZapB
VNAIKHKSTTQELRAQNKSLSSDNQLTASERRALIKKRDALRQEHQVIVEKLKLSDSTAASPFFITV